VNVLGLGLWGAEEEGWGQSRSFDFNPKKWLRYFIP